MQVKSASLKIGNKRERKAWEDLGLDREWEEKE